jgi:hypothetical protein
MHKAKRIRIALTCIVLMAILTGSLGLRFGVRHRHDGGEGAHSHDGDEPHSHAHFHTFGHFHSHVHSDNIAHSHSAEHSHAHSDSHSHGSHDDQDADESHIHLILFGFSLTLPDFGFEDPAPLVSLEQDDKPSGYSGERVELPFPFTLASILQLWMEQTGVPVTMLSLHDAAGRREFITPLTEQNLGRDASPPPLPPPRISTS